MLEILWPEVLAEVGGKHEVYDGVGGRVERGEALYEGGDGPDRLVAGDELVDLEHVEDDVGGPAQDEHWNRTLVPVFPFVQWVIKQTTSDGGNLLKTN